MDNEPTNHDDLTDEDLRAFDTEPATGDSTGATTDSSPITPETSSAMPDTPAEPEASSVPPESPSPMPPKKNRHLVRNLIIAGAALIILAIVAAVVWKSIQPKPIATKSTTPALVQTDDTAKTIVGKITTVISNESGKNYQAPQITQATPFSSPPATSPSYKVSGADYYVTTARTYSVTANSPKPDGTTADQAFAKAIIDQVSAVLASNHLNKADTLTFGTEYQSNSTICLVSAPDTIPVSVSCADKVDYKSASDAIKPFAMAYEASADYNSANDRLSSVFSTPVIKDSSVSGYQNASLSISSRQGVGGAVLLFYQNGKSGWQFFVATQNILSCNQYHSADEQAAFADEKCIDGNQKETTVGASQTAAPAPAPTASPTPPAVPPKQPVR